MTDTVLDIDRVRQLFDLRGSFHDLARRGLRRTTLTRSGAALREKAPVHAGVVHELTGFEGSRLSRPALSRSPALLGLQLRRMRPGLPQRQGLRLVRPRQSICPPARGPLNSMLSMGGTSTAATGPWCSRRSCRPRPNGGSGTGSRRRSTSSSTASRTRGGRSSTSTSARPSRSSPSPAASASLSSRPRHPGGAAGAGEGSWRSSAPIVAARRESPAGRSHQHPGRGRDQGRGRADAPSHRCRDLLVHPAPAGGRFGDHLEADGHHPRRAAAAPRGAASRPRGPAPAAAGDRGVAAVDADRPDVLPLGHRGHRIPRCPPAQGLGPAHLPRRGQPRPGPLGAARRVRHHAAAQAEPWPSAADRTSASACTWPEPR